LYTFRSSNLLLKLILTKALFLGSEIIPIIEEDIKRPLTLKKDLDTEFEVNIVNDHVSQRKNLKGNDSTRHPRR